MGRSSQLCGQARMITHKNNKGPGMSTIPAPESSTSEIEDGRGQAPAFSPAYLRWVLGVLVVVYVFNFIDRSILTVLSQQIKVEFHLSDFQLGALGGFFFALLYTAFGIPIARLAERHDRVTIIAVATGLWSLMTALCGTATGFWHLALYRLGVGIGEAGCTPPAHSLISDYFPPHKRATALSIYSLGIPFGSLIGTVAGGYLAQDLGWRAAFMVVGLPGLIIAVLLRLTLKDPPRGHSETPSGRPMSPSPSLLDVFRVVRNKATFGHIAFGGALVSFVGYGGNQFSLTYFLRQFHLDLKTTSFALGITAGLASAIGTLAGGMVTDYLAKRDKRWYAWTPAIALVVAVPLWLCVLVQDQWTVAIALLLIPGIFQYTYLGPTFGLTHNMVEPRMRASATALLLFVINIIGLGFGPPVVGWLSDVFAAGAYAGDFAQFCPGGVAMAGADPELKAACLQASADGNRYALMVNALILAWGGFHYYMASRTLRKDVISL